MEFPGSPSSYVDLDTLFSDPPAVRWRREEAYLRDQMEGVSKKVTQVKKRAPSRTKSPYTSGSSAVRKKRPVSARSGFEGHLTSPRIEEFAQREKCLVEKYELLKKEAEDRERCLRKREREVLKREKEVAVREMKAHFESDASHAAQAAANAAAYLSSKLANRLSRRTASLAALQHNLTSKEQKKPQAKNLPQIQASSSVAEKKRQEASTSDNKKKIGTTKSQDHSSHSDTSQTYTQSTQRLRRLTKTATRRVQGQQHDAAMPRDLIAKRQKCRGDCVLLTKKTKTQLEWKGAERCRLFYFNADMDLSATHIVETSQGSRCTLNTKDFAEAVFAVAAVLEPCSSDQTQLKTKNFVWHLAETATTRLETIEPAVIQLERETRPTFFHEENVSQDNTDHTEVYQDIQKESKEIRIDTTLSARCVFKDLETKPRAYLCGAFFRSPLSKETQSWRFKPIFTHLHHAQTPAGRVGLVARSLALANVQPYAVVDIEHCRNCEDHVTTTKHIPGSYEKKFRCIERALHSEVPHTLVTSNYTNAPRIGAFELRCLAYDATRSALVFSKFGAEAFPSSAEAVTGVKISSRLCPHFDAKGQSIRIQVLVENKDRAPAGIPIALFRARKGGCAFGVNELQISSPAVKEVQSKIDDDSTKKDDDIPRFRRVSSIKAQPSAHDLSLASKLQDWTKRQVLTWLRDECGLSAEEARHLTDSAGLESGPDLLNITEQHVSAALPNLAGRRRALLDTISKIRAASYHPTDNELTENPSDYFFRCWELVAAPQKTKSDGSCTFDQISTSAPLMALHDTHTGDCHFHPWSVFLRNGQTSCTLQLLPITIRLNISTQSSTAPSCSSVPLHLELISINRTKATKIFARLSDQGQVCLTLPTDSYVLSLPGNYRRITANTDTTISEIPLLAVEGFSLKRRDVCARRIQRLIKKPPAFSVANKDRIKTTQMIHQTSSAFVANILSSPHHYGARDCIEAPVSTSRQIAQLEPDASETAIFEAVPPAELQSST